MDALVSFIGFPGMRGFIILPVLGISVLLARDLRVSEPRS